MPDPIQAAIQDPQFSSFTPDAQRRILNRLDPSISNLTDEQFQSAVQRLRTPNVPGMERLGGQAPGIPTMPGNGIPEPEGLETPTPGPFAQAHPILSELWKGTATPIPAEMAAGSLPPGLISRGVQTIRTLIGNPKARDAVIREIPFGKAALKLRDLTAPVEPPPFSPVQPLSRVPGFGGPTDPGYSAPSSYRVVKGAPSPPPEAPPEPFQPYRPSGNVPRFGGSTAPNYSPPSAYPVVGSGPGIEGPLTPQPSSTIPEPYRAPRLKNIPKYGGPSSPTTGPGSSRPIGMTGPKFAPPVPDEPIAPIDTTTGAPVRPISPLPEGHAPMSQEFTQGGSPVPTNAASFKHPADYTDLNRQFHATWPKGTSLRDIASKVYGTDPTVMPSYDQALKIHEFMLKNNGKIPGPKDLGK